MMLYSVNHQLAMIDKRNWKNAMWWVIMVGVKWVKSHDPQQNITWIHFCARSRGKTPLIVLYVVKKKKLWFIYFVIVRKLHLFGKNF